jgi:hypothetical protein
MSNKVRVVHETRAHRSAREFWKKFFIWAFILVFAFSVAGGLIVFAIPR